MMNSRYRVVETGDYELIGASINQMNEQGYRPILMSQIVKESRVIGTQIVTTLVFEREPRAEFKGIEVLVNSGKIDALTGVPCPAIESQL
ncbi:unnamed protein product [marine sediment metagenome]|uniref:Uncharacterized protein n=1 Tax=marine sediment metagenome TaxID=412755 RepID=X0RYT9_9ZZZZ